MKSIYRLYRDDEIINVFVLSFKSGDKKPSGHAKNAITAKKQSGSVGQTNAAASPKTQERIRAYVFSFNKLFIEVNKQRE